MTFLDKISCDHFKQFQQHRLVRFNQFFDSIIPKKLIIFGTFAYLFLIYKYISILLKNMDYLKLKYNGIHHQFPLNYICYIFCFRAVCYSILHVLLTLYGLLFKTFDERDDFNVPIVNFPLICSNIPAAPAYGVYISQLIRYSRACGTYQDFLDRGFVLTTKLLNQGFLLVQFKSSLRKLNGPQHDLVYRYGISVSQMKRDMFHLS